MRALPLARRGSGGRGRRASGEGARDEGSRNKSLFPVSRSSCTQTTLACSPCLDVFHVYCTRSRSNFRKMYLLMYPVQLYLISLSSRTLASLY